MDGISWFPQGYANEFYILKGMLSLAATCLLIIHMHRTWDATASPGQRLRYLSLLYFAVLITASSVEQTQQDVAVNYRNVGAIIGVGLLIYTMVVSLREYLRDLEHLTDAADELDP